MSSEDSVPYSTVSIWAWSVLSVVFCVVLFLAFAFNGPLLHAGNWIWDLIRYFAKPII